MGKIRQLSERVMRGEEVGFHPFTPQFASEEEAERTAFVSSFANVLALSTEEGRLSRRALVHAKVSITG